jgi:hypothetical protein
MANWKFKSNLLSLFQKQPLELLSGVMRIVGFFGESLLAFGQ